MSEYEKNLGDESPTEDSNASNIPDNELNPESNPMKISGSKYLSKNAQKAVIGTCIIGIGILLTALWGAELFDDPHAVKKDDKSTRPSIADNTISAEIINRTAGPESIIPLF